MSLRKAIEEVALNEAVKPKYTGTFEKGRGPTGIAYSIPSGHPDAENPKTRKKYPERQTPQYKKEYKALLKTENVDLEYSEDGIETIANLATEVNSSVENIGARRLHTIIERILDEISFTATDRSGEKSIIDSKYVKENLGQLVKDNDLSKFIL